MLSQLLIAAVPFTMGALAEPLEGRANVAEAELYAYGPNGIGGFPIVNIGGNAYISGKPLGGQNATVHEVMLTSTRNGTMVAHTNNETLLLAIPAHGDIRFVASADDSLITTGFGWYGQMLYVRMDGQMVTLWTAKPTAEPHVYQLGWNVSGTPPLSIRNVAPSHP